MHPKIRSLNEIGKIIELEKSNGQKIVQCHGVFDLLHPGHIRHFKEAKKQGDKLVVTVTPDRFVNKGPGRPVFNEELRLESLASLSVVDYVVLNDEPTAIGAIYSVKPNIYVKGAEYQEHSKDITGKIAEEAKAVESGGGAVVYTDDVVFSSSSLLNRFFEEYSDEVKAFLLNFKKTYSTSQVLKQIEALRKLKVLVVGDAIIDEYQYVSPLGQSGKGLHMSAVLEEKEIFLGGSLIIANHMADFAGEVKLLTAFGDACPYKEFVQKELDVGTTAHFLPHEKTLVKKRYVTKDGARLSKLFETYSTNEFALPKRTKKAFREQLLDLSQNVDLVLVSDFGNGLIDSELAKELSKLPQFLALNVQSNSGNRGFNVVTKYSRANFISINEPELRLAVHDREHPLEKLLGQLQKKVECKKVSITSGVKGLTCFTDGAIEVKVPAFANHTVDRVGAGDSYFALASMCLAAGASHELAGFVGALAAAMDVQIVGNRESIRKVPLCKYITRVLK